MNQIRNFSAPDFVLAGKTIDIRAGTPDPPPLDDDRLLSGLCQMPGKVFSAFAAPDDDVLMILHTHNGVGHCSLPAGNSSKVARASMHALSVWKVRSSPCRSTAVNSNPTEA